MEQALQAPHVRSLKIRQTSALICPEGLRRGIEVPGEAVNPESVGIALIRMEGLRQPEHRNGNALGLHRRRSCPDLYRGIETRLHPAPPDRRGFR
jgi:hypothetical protein